jgi:hypothetical protein
MSRAEDHPSDGQDRNDDEGGPADRGASGSGREGQEGPSKPDRRPPREDDSRGAGEADTETPSRGGAANTDDDSETPGGERADQT